MSTLVVLVILGAVGALVLTSIPYGDSSSEKQAKSLLSELNAPPPPRQGPAPTAARTTVGGPSSGNPPSLASNSRTAACRANVGVIESAIATKHATDGTYPSSIEELVTGRWLDAEPSMVGYQMSLEIDDGQATGRLLVNGHPGIQGCDAPARTAN